MRLLAALALALAAAPAAAQPDRVINFPPGANASRDGFVAAIVTTGSLDQFAEAWIAGRPQSAITRIAVRGRELKAVVLLSGCRAGPEGKCDVSGRFTYTVPGGGRYGVIDDDALFNETARAGDGVLVALGPTLIVDPPDPMGEWTLQAEIRDNVRGTTIIVRTPILVESPPTGSNG
ncbi:MAG TPA: hypothetical protein VMG08_06015 [Allosphingosinicella sp.]|nr:hypothetical protein [Allosphingosinicella sp.]